MPDEIIEEQESNEEIIEDVDVVDPNNPKTPPKKG